MVLLRHALRLLALLACAAVLTAPAAHAGPMAITADSSASAAGQILGLVNVDRAAAGLAPVQWRDDIAAIAQGWSASMAATAVLSHNDDFFSPLTHSLLGTQVEGENVGHSGAMAAVELGFMN